MTTKPLHRELAERLATVTSPQKADELMGRGILGMTGRKRADPRRMLELNRCTASWRRG